MKYFYITNKPEIAKICDENGVIPWIDLEVLGKEERQKGMNTVKSNHSIEDVYTIKQVLKNMPLMVRVNPLNPNSENEINSIIEKGADIVMLPMFKNKTEVETFINHVNKRAKVMLLFETKESVDNIESILNVNGIDYVHIGLNDLHLLYGLSFMFELISNGTVEKICEIFEKHNLEYGFGGIAKLGYGDIPAEFIISEHRRLCSKAVILSRSFCNYDLCTSLEEFENTFIKELKNIECFWKANKFFSKLYFEKNKEILNVIINKIVKDRG